MIPQRRLLLGVARLEIAIQWFVHDTVRGSRVHGGFREARHPEGPVTSSSPLIVAETAGEFDEAQERHDFDVSTAEELMTRRWVRIFHIQQRSWQLLSIPRILYRAWELSHLIVWPILAVMKPERGHPSRSTLDLAMLDRRCRRCWSRDFSRNSFFNTRPISIPTQAVRTCGQSF